MLKPGTLKKNILWIIGGAIAVYFVSRYAGFLKKANFYLQSVKPGGTITQPKIIVMLGVDNPTNQTITIKSIVGNVFVEGDLLAIVNSFGDQKIAANSSSTINVTAKPTAIGVFKTLKRLITQPIPGTKIEFDGTANVDGINVPIKQSITL